MVIKYIDISPVGIMSDSEQVYTQTNCLDVRSFVLSCFFTTLLPANKVFNLHCDK